MGCAWVYFHALGLLGVLVGGSCRGKPRMGRPSVGVADWQHCGRRSTDQDLQRSYSDDFFQGLCSTALPVPEVIPI